MSLADEMNAEIPKAIAQEGFKNNIPKGAYHYFFKQEVDYWGDGEIDTKWVGEQNYPLIEEDNYLDKLHQDNDFIGYANPVGSSYGVHDCPQSGVKCLFRVKFIRKVDYLYFQPWHKELGRNFTNRQLMQDEDNGVSHIGKVGSKLTVKLTGKDPISLFMVDFKSLKIDEDKIIECPLKEADIKATHGC